MRYGDTGQLYRIIKSDLQDGDTGVLNISCEHVIATLCDDLMFGAKQYGGGTIRTPAVITWLLNQQTTKNWILAECDFDRRFEYLWEQENILNALYSIPKEFSKAYKWTFDTTTYPWRLSLKAIDETIHPEYYIRAKRNMLSSGTAQDFADICTRIYPLGYGEGVNQMTIKEAKVTNVRMINNVAVNATVDAASETKYGNTYIQSPDEIIALYGIKQKVLVDRRFEDPNSLFSYAQTTLEALQVPSMSRSFDVIDLYPLTSQDIDNAEPGKICKMTGDDTIAYVTKTVRVLDDPGNLQIDLSTKATDVASTIADLADRVRIESVYAQGATQLYQHSKDDNATSEKGSVLNLYFPEEMRQINKVLLKVQLDKFRSYSNTAKSNGGFKQTYTIDDSSKDITSQTNTENKELTVREQTQTYSVEASEKEYSVSESSQTYSVEASEKEYSVREQSQTYSVGAQDKTVTASVSAIKTTNMTADTGQNISTTMSGGGTGQTSVESGGGGISLDPSSISVTVNIAATGSDSWNGTDIYSKFQKVYGLTTGNLDTGSHTHSTDYDGNHGHAISDESYQGHRHSISDDDDYTGYEKVSGLSIDSNYGSHKHTISFSGGHKHSIEDESFQGHRHAIDTALLKHWHTFDAPVSGSITVNNTEAGQSGFSHSHSFRIGDHSHTLNIGHQHNYDISHSHTITIPGHSHTIKIPAHSHTITIPGHSHTIKIPGHSHNIKIPGHSHNIKIPGHSHTFACPSHKHNITIPGHSHTVEIPAHDHVIEPGIFEDTKNNSDGFSIWVNGVWKQTFNKQTSWEGDITQWLLNDKNQVPRDSWIKVEIRPNNLAYVISSVFVQGFVQSRGGGNY